MSFSVSIEGLDDLLKRLDAAGKPDALKDGLDGLVPEMISEKRLKGYPPVPAGSRYSRTNKLRNSWAKDESRSNGSTLVLGSDSKSVPYNRYVMDEDMQTWFHKAHGWNTAQGILRANVKFITEYLRKHLQAALNGKG